MYSSRSSWWNSIPPVTKNLIIINLIIWLVEILFPRFAPVMLRHLALHPVNCDAFNPVQLITYMFLHSPTSPLHILFNMFTLWMFGRILEQVWGARRFFVYYMVCGIGAALVQEAVWAFTLDGDYISWFAGANGITLDHAREYIERAVATGDTQIISALDAYRSSVLTVGASGAIFGLLLAFAFMFPDMPLYLFFIPVPIKAKYMVIGYGVIEFFLGIGGAASTVAHFAHLGGMLFGLVLLLYWRKRRFN